MNLTEKTVFLETLKTAIITVKQRLIYTLASPEELFNALLKDELFNKTEFFKEAEQLITECGFESGWKSTVNKQLLLSNDEKNVISSVADILGKSDLETQVNQLEVIIGQLTSIIIKQKSKSDDYRKLYTTLGLLSALSLTVLFI